MLNNSFTTVKVKH